ncbi:IclR family transcriptional regulator [Paraburkholderia sp.]|uniref:IclR family transcriptional regulator n=1 Tax=Paraburkholderia sp. TaxID=1926495 RepID=UPI003C7E9378
MEGETGTAEHVGIAASQTLDRAVQVLKLVAGSGAEGMALSEIVRLTNLTKPTARRLLLALIANGLVEQHIEKRRYYAGLETYALGVLAAERFNVHRLAADSLTRIAARVGDAALLIVQRGYETICLAREEGTYPLRSHVLQPGDRHPIGCGAGGLVLLSMLSDAEVNQALTFNAERLATDYAGVTPELLMRQVRETRAQGYGLNRGLIVKGSCGVGISIYDSRSATPAALVIAGVESRFTDDRIEEMVAILRDEKARLEVRMQRFDAAPSSSKLKTTKEGPAESKRQRKHSSGDLGHV